LRVMRRLISPGEGDDGGREAPRGGFRARFLEES
jgi:hypothetical protein